MGTTHLALLAAVVVALAAPAAAVVDVTACGQTIPAGETGVLQADLDCSIAPVGVRLLSRATLDLNGHTIAGGDSTQATVAGVRALSDNNPIGSGHGNITIVGPGVISGTNQPPFPVGTFACVLVNSGRARISGVSGPIEIRGCVYGVHGGALYTADGSLDPRGPEGRSRVELDHVTVRQSLESAVSVRRLTATDVAAIDNLGGGLFASRRMMVANVVANNNRNIGIFGGRRLEGTNVTAVGNQANGVDTCGFGRIVLTNLVATNNGVFGVCGDRVALTDSTATDNASADIVSLVAPPVLVGTTCGTSLAQNGSSWGVCAND